MEENKNNQGTQSQNSNETVDQTTTNNSGNVNTNNQNTQSNQQNNQNVNVVKTFTQEQVNRMMTAEKNQGREAAFREMGINPNDPNTMNMMNMFKAFMSAMQTPEQQTQQIQNQVAQQQVKITEAENRALKAEVKADAMQNGILGQYVDDAVVIIMSKLDDKTDVKTVVGELKNKYPVWFGIDGNTQQQNNNSNSTGQQGTGSSVGNASGKGGQGKNKAEGLGARLAAQRKTSSVKKSFWD